MSDTLFSACPLTPAQLNTLFSLRVSIECIESGILLGFPPSLIREHYETVLRLSAGMNPAPVEVG
jgi:hypothetical protein